MENRSTTCKLDDCEKPYYAQGWCRLHYVRWRRHGDPHAGARPERSTVCAIEDCDTKRTHREWCQKHYKRWKKHGDPLAEPWRGCSIEGCEGQHQAHRYCRRHLYRLKKYGDPLGGGPERKRKPKPPCSHEGCGKTSHVKGYCPSHFHRFSKYGITPEQYDAALERGCPICLRKVDTLAVDHDHACCPGGHTCGECVRDFICRTCNAMLGMANDNPDVLMRAVAYLARFRTEGVTP